jgi:hypothetical protein
MLNFICEYYDELLAVIGALCVIASFIVKLTPTPKDDKILGKIQSFVEKFSIVARNKKEELVKLNEKVKEKEKDNG